MDLEVDLLGCIGYDNSKLKVVNDMTVCFLSGAQLVIWDLSSNERRYIASSKQGFQRFETCPKQGLIILVEYQIQPNILVYRHEKLVQTIPGIVDFEVLDLVLSRDGEKLAVVQGCPTYELVVYDLVQEKVVKGDNSKIIVDESDYLDFKFNPTNNLEFAILNEGQLEVYRLENEFRAGQEGGEESMNKEHRLQQQSVQLKDSAERKLIEWDQMDNIYLAEDNLMSVIRAKDMEVILKKELQTAVQHILMTQMHVIVVYKSSYMEWLFKYDPQFINDKTTEPLTMDKYYLFLEGQVIHVTYDHFFNNIVLSTEDNSIYLLNIKGQNIMDDEDEDAEKPESQQDGEDEEDNNRIECDPIKYGPHSQNTQLFVHKLSNYDILLSVTSNAEIHFVDIQSRNVVRNYYFTLDINCFAMDSSEKLMVMGTPTGCLRLLDCRDFNNIQTVQVFKFYENKSIDFLHFYKGGRILVGSKQSKKIHVLQKNSEEYELQGVLRLPAPLVYLSLDGTSILAMMNYLVIQTQQLEHLNEFNDFDWKLNGLKCRKVDPALDLGVQHEDNLFLVGKDKLLKQYPRCEDDLYDYDLRIKTPGLQPAHEYPGYEMVLAQLQSNGKHLVGGGKDGVVYIRDFAKIEQVQKVQVQSLPKGGVSALSINKDSTVLSVGGFDAAVYMYCLNKGYEFEGITSLKSSDVQIPYSDLNKLQDDQIVNYKQIQLDAKNQQLKLENQKDEEITLKNIDSIRNALLEIINKNEAADEMEKLEKDEFCIDVERRDQNEKQCNEEQQLLKEQAEQQIEIQQQIFSRIKKQTYDQMAVHLKAINGIKDNIIVYNYQVKRQNTNEENHLNKVLQMRKIEITEKYMRMEAKIKELIQVQELCKNPDNYIINVYPGKPENFVFNDYEKKEEIKEKKGEQVQKTTNIKSKNYRDFLGFTIFRNKDDMNKLEELKAAAATMKKEDPEALEQMQQETHEEIKQLQQALEQKRDVEEMSLWDFLYSQLELYSNNQKRNQVLMIQSIIHSIKEEFNIEFELAAKMRINQIESINEKNKRMLEIQNDLKMAEEEFPVKASVMDAPESVLEVSSQEVGMERYLSREERARVEAERIKEEERLLALQKDDAGIRALKQMMGGTLQEKKETPLTETLEREEWMDKPVEEMDDEQRAKLREFEVKQQKLNEEREKITKNLKNELMQLNSQTQEIQRHFDDKLLVLQKRKLEFDQRINEQYLVLITLVQSLLVNSERVNKFIEMQKFVQEVEGQIAQMHIQSQQLEGYHAVLVEQKKTALENYDAALTQNKGDLQGIMNVPQIYQQVFDENNMANYKKEDEENLTNLDTYKNQLFQLDPYYMLELKRISAERETDFDNFIHKIKENYQFSQLVFEDENQKNLMIQLFRKKFNLKVVHTQQHNKLKELEDYIDYYRNQLSQQEELLSKNKLVMQEIQRIQKQSVSDIEIMVRIKQGNVEIFQDRPVPSLSDAILIPQKTIENLNRDIKMQGGSQIEALNQIKNTKFDVAKAEYDKRKKNLELKQIEVKIKQIQMLKVKKEMQVALQKKDMKLNENELKNLNEQIDKIKDTTDKRIQLIKKKEESILKEIQFIKKENQQLYVQGGNLSQAVKQRAEIKDMYEKKMNIKDKDDKTDKEANEKFKLISCVRRLHNHVVKQTEEIQILKEELTKLRYKTFTDFTNIGHQQI